nr:hypothetical protein [Chryseobacterium sp. P1-3]
MKKLLFGALMLGVMSACNSDSLSTQNETPSDPSTASADLVKRGCASEEIRQEALRNSAELRQRYSTLEANTEKFTNDLKLGKVLADGSVEIPVIVNVIYKTSAEKRF